MEAILDTEKDIKVINAEGSSQKPNKKHKKKKKPNRPALNIEPEQVEPIDLDSFLANNYEGKLIKLQKENFDQLKRPLIIAFHYYNEKCGAHLKKLTDKLYQAAVKYEGLIQYVVADIQDVTILNLNLDLSDFSINSPLLVYAFDEENIKYHHRWGRITAFSADILNKELFWSEPIPTENDELVKIAVAHNFDELVLQSDKDVFLTFYAAWCDRANQIPSMLNELAELLKDDSILIAKMTSETNHVRLEYELSCYTKSFLIPRDESKRVQYCHETYTLENLLKFIAVNSTDELKAYDREGSLK